TSGSWNADFALRLTALVNRLALFARSKECRFTVYRCRPANDLRRRATATRRIYYTRTISPRFGHSAFHLGVDLSRPDWRHHRIHRLHLPAAALRSGEGGDLRLRQSDRGGDSGSALRGRASHFANYRGGGVDHWIGRNCYHHATIKAEIRATGFGRIGRSGLGHPRAPL